MLNQRQESPDRLTRAAYTATAVQVATRKSTRIAAQNKNGSRGKPEPLPPGFLLRSGRRIVWSPEQVLQVFCTMMLQVLGGPRSGSVNTSVCCAGPGGHWRRHAGGSRQTCRITFSATHHSASRSALASAVPKDASAATLQDLLLHFSSAQQVCKSALDHFSHRCEGSLWWELRRVAQAHSWRWQRPPAALGSSPAPQARAASRSASPA